MAALAFVGAMMGIVLAYWTTRSKKNFRAKLLTELEKHSRTGTAARYVTGIARYKVQWMKSVSLIRKPFSKEVNMTIETAAMILSIAGLVSSITNFDQRFSGPTEGITVLIFLGLVMAYIPSEWLFSRTIEADMEAVLQELVDSTERGALDEYIAEARESWVSN